jgi:hypothetical protein
MEGARRNVSASACGSNIYIYGAKGLTNWRARSGETSDDTAGHLDGSLGLHATRVTPVLHLGRSVGASATRRRVEQSHDQECFASLIPCIDHQPSAFSLPWPHSR